MPDAPDLTLTPPPESPAVVGGANNLGREAQVIRSAWEIDDDEVGPFILTRPRAKGEHDAAINVYVTPDARDAVVLLVANAGVLLKAAEDRLKKHGADSIEDRDLYIAILACGGKVW